MKKVTLQLFLIGVSALLSWWFLLRAPDQPPPSPAPVPPVDLTLVLSPQAASAAEETVREETVQDPPPPKAVMGTPAPEPEPEPEKQPPPEPAAPSEPVEEKPAPPPAEAGTPDGDPEESAAADPEPEPRTDPSADAVRELETIEGSKELMRQAKEEVSGKSRKGFRTTFLCTARDQLDIARYFGEPVVLVPRAGLRPGSEYYHRLVLTGEPGIEEVRSPAPLTRYRQYRDLFAFSYESLPRPMRELRRRVFVRGDVYLFAALIPPREWGLVIVRRDAALEKVNRGRGGRKRTHDDVKNFTMRYVRLPGGAFDIQVAGISFDDGTVVDTTNGGMR